MSEPVRQVVPIRALARDGDAEFVVYRAPAPPATADQRFREASVPLARVLRRLAADARTATAAAGTPDAAPADLARTLGAELRAALADLRALAEGYDVRPVAAFCAGREAGAAALDPRTLAAVDAAAAGLLGGRPAAPPPAPAQPAPAEAPGQAGAPAAPRAPNDSAPNAATPNTAASNTAAPDAAPTGAAPGGVAPNDPAPRASSDGSGGPDAPGRGDAFRPPTGDALVALLETGISGLGFVDALAEVTAAPAPAAEAAAPAEPAAPVSATPVSAASTPADDGVVPIERLLYEGRAALDRARAVRDELRARPGAPDPALLAELYDLLDLAAAG